MTTMNKKERQLSLIDLAEEIIIDILERLDSLARIRFSAVCKGWKLLIQRLLLHLGEAEELPWLMAFDYPSIIIREPCFSSHQKKSYITIKHDLEQEPIDAISQAIEDRRVLAKDAKFGWVAFDIFIYGQPSNLFLYSPFTKKYIYLPPDLPCHPFRVSISHPPICPDCVFFAFFEREFDMCPVSLIYTCHIGDKNWKKHDIIESIPRGSDLESVMFLGGSFYCLFDRGTLAAFNTATESWAMLTELNPLIDEPPIINGEQVSPEFSLSRCNFHLVKSHRDIWLVLISEVVELPGSVGCSVWKYEWGKWGWTKMKSLGGRVMFVDMLYTGTAAVDAAGPLEGLADRIYYDSDDGYYYSLQDDKVHHDPHLDEDELFKQSLTFWTVSPSPQL